MERVYLFWQATKQWKIFKSKLTETISAISLNGIKAWFLLFFFCFNIFSKIDCNLFMKYNKKENKTEFRQNNMGIKKKLSPWLLY